MRRDHILQKGMPSQSLPQAEQPEALLGYTEATHWQPRLSWARGQAEAAELVGKETQQGTAACLDIGA
jgi:hypothetical protein